MCIFIYLFPFLFYLVGGGGREGEKIKKQTQPPLSPRDVKNKKSKTQNPTPPSFFFFFLRIKLLHDSQNQDDIGNRDHRAPNETKNVQWEQTSAQKLWFRSAFFFLFVEINK